MSALNRLRLYVRAQQFAPTWLGPFVNPFFLARRALHRELGDLAGQVGGRMLDVGCGRKPYRGLFNVTEYVGLDYDTPSNREYSHADYFYDGKTFPFSDASFDTVLCSQVLEHVFNPGEFLTEVRRVLKPGGKLLLTVPFVWDEHEQPYDYARYSSFGLKHLVQLHGLTPILHRKTLADFSLFGQLLGAFFYKIAWTRRSWINYLLLLTVMAPITLASMLVAKILPGNPDLYLDNILLAERAA